MADEDGPLCCCGSRTDALEALASAASVIETVKVALEKGVSSKVLELAEDDPTKITIEIMSRLQPAQDGATASLIAP